MRAPPVAESSELSEWQRSVCNAAALSARRAPGTATGHGEQLLWMLFLLVCLVRQEGLVKLRFASVQPTAATVHRTVAFNGSSPREDFRNP